MTIQKKRVIFYHGGCRDGFGAAWAAYCYWGDRADYEPILHYRPLPELSPQSEIWFLDFCPRAKVLVDLLDAGHSVNVLDHHITAKDVIDAVESPRLDVVLDLDHSGAVIAWKHFFPTRKVPLLLQLIEDRDIWKWEFDETEAVTEALDALEWSFDLFDRLHRRTSELGELAKAGRLLVQFKEKKIAEIVKRAVLRDIGGHVVPTVNSDSFVSHLGNALAMEYPERAFGAVWFRMADGHDKWSLRSIGDFNVAEVAKLYGGGGHKNAAGFVSPPSQG